MKQSGIGHYDIIIIGGGAAGLYAASLLAQSTVRNPAERKRAVLILEKNSKAGRKLLLTGGGKCNLTCGGSIKDFTSHYGKSGSMVRPVLYAHNNLAVRRHFATLGVETTERGDGKIFPRSMRAAEVQQALLAAAAGAGFEIKTGCGAHRIRPLVSSFSASESGTETTSPCPALFDSAKSQGSGYLVETENGGSFRCRRLILACGGCSVPSTGSDGSMFPILRRLGIEVTELRPSLTPVSVQNYPYASLSGLSFPNVELRIESEQQCMSGDLLFTHNALSGPLILNASRYLKTGSRITLSYLPDICTSELTKMLSRLAHGNHGTVETLLCQTGSRFGRILPRRFAETIVLETASGLQGRKAATLSGKDFAMLADRLTNDSFSVSGTGSWNTAMCTAGGVALSEVHLKTMESKKYPGLFLIGECLDIDGDTGGYNLQFAFSSAAAAVSAIHAAFNAAP